MELCTKGADPHVEEALATDQSAYMYGNLLQTMMGRSLQLRALPAGHRGLFAAIFTIFAMNINYCKLAGRYIALQRDNILQGEDNTTALHTVPNSYMHAIAHGLHTLMLANPIYVYMIYVHSGQNSIIFTFTHATTLN